jgi:hypothetical protein
MEFRLLKERFGLCELEDALFKTLDPEIIDLSLRDFEWLCRQYAHSVGRFNRAGYGYEKRSGGVFLKATRNYVDSIVDHTYSKTWHFYDFKLSYLKLICQRTMRKLLGSKSYGDSRAYLAYPTEAQFRAKTKTYLKIVLDGFLREQAAQQDKVLTEESFLVLPKSIPLYKQQNVTQITRYFDDPRIILIDRDPRDIFLDMFRGKKRYLPNSKDSEKIALAFVRYCKKIREEQKLVAQNENVVLVHFEDMINDYDNSLAQLYNFIGVEEKHHDLKGRFFNPSDSIRNIGLWKNCDESEAKAIEVIGSEIGDH